MHLLYIRLLNSAPLHLRAYQSRGGFYCGPTCGCYACVAHIVCIILTCVVACTTLASTLASVLELDAPVLDFDAPGLALEASRDGGQEEDERDGDCSEGKDKGDRFEDLAAEALDDLSRVLVIGAARV